MVAGNPVSHSLSPQIHREFARQTRESLEYERLLIPEGGFQDEALKFFAQGGRGMNITVPCKEDAFRCARILTSRAKLAGAVNTLWPGPDGLLHGDNTDGVGLLRDLRGNLSWQLSARRLLILGAGGAVRGILGPLLECSPASVTIANRNIARGQALVREFAPHEPNVPLQATGFEHRDGPFELIIHATSAGLGGDMPELPSGLACPQTAAYDLTYRAGPTPFLQWAADQGVIRLSDGLGMLVEQAAESFWCWRQCRPQTAPVLRALRSALTELGA